MDTDKMLTDFKKKVCAEISLEQEGAGRYLVHTPFMFDDGDHFKIVLKKDETGELVFTDEGQTFMQLSYEDVELDTKTRSALVDAAKNMFGIEDREGELVIPIKKTSYGDALFSFIQALSKISDVSYIKQERVRNAFYEDFQKIIVEVAPKGKVQFDYSEPKADPKGDYRVDAVIEGKVRPMFIFAVHNDAKCKDATIIIQHYDKSGVDFWPVVIFENQEEINRRDLARLTNVCEKQFASLEPVKDGLQKYIVKHEALV